MRRSKLNAPTAAAPRAAPTPKTAPAELTALLRSRFAKLNEQRREVAARVGKKLGVPQA